MAKNTICLWYDKDAEAAARFYAKIFPDSAVGAVHRAPSDYPSGKKGDVLTVEFTVAGVPCLGLAHFAQRLHQEISTTRPNKVAIDLRRNRGGDGTLIVPIIRCIIQSENIDRPGHLFGIIGPATFSAAQMLTDALEIYTNILFVGEPTGSKGNAYGDSRKMILPNSGITVRASIYYWQDWHPMDQRDATIPQIPAPLKFEAYRQKMDPALEAIARYDEESKPAR